MSTAIKKVAPQVRSYAPLNSADRCDATRSAAALVRIVRTKDGKEQDMLLSAHYYQMSEATLVAGGWEVYEDIRQAVLNPPKTAYDTSEH